MLARAATDALSKSRPVFRFKGCLHAPPPPSARTLSAAAAPPTNDDLALVTLFDQPPPLPRLSSRAHTGIFGHSVLQSPAGFHALADATLHRARLLTDRILRARESRDELLKVVKNLDRLSDLLCGVIDLAELVRNAHPDALWINTANDVYERLCEFMNVLNTDVGLYEVLKATLNDASIVSTLSEEARQTALIFWRDFEKSGINLPPEQRNRFVSLSSEILVLGRHFLNETTSAKPPARIERSELEGLKDKGMGVRLQLQAQFTRRELLVYPGSLQAQMIMRSAPSEEARRKVYIASNSSSPEQIEILERLLRARAELAQLVGKDSFAHMALTDKMAKCPENVHHFLSALMDYTKPYARRALRMLSHRKQAHHGTGPEPIIQAWDRDYYCPPEPPAPPIPLPPLTLGTVFMGLSRLFKHIYGITFRPADVASGEVWHTDVRKLEVLDEECGVIGWIYADLFARRGKASGAAHYTVRCSRRVDHDDLAGDYRVSSHAGPGEDLLGKVSDDFEAAHRRQIRGHEGIYQLPVVVLLCEFPRPSITRGPTVLEWHEVLTLFHEMGHAMHSMIGRTEYQNVSGTRCATDFVELPSILMEHFLNSSAVLGLFDKNDGVLTAQVGNHHEDPCRSIDTHTQMMLAALDQIYHSSAVLNPNFDSTAALARLYDDQGLIPYVPGTSWQTQFGHLFGYGATYYSYLFDRAIASRVWRELFASDPLNRNVGERYKQEVLRQGGAKDPWIMVGKLLHAPELADGDAEAMRKVGMWRIEDDVSVPGRH
ncbi:mitochondrial intermediate peptidase [Punctularia strigosozonata HHB-11173 SS5]|uniref:mitochondrial intermediate peptidase n=1 Tax=Punctularia strigosozonata (strain HHB-11173) TaxID=741275 RepID=UPI00044182B8|nr:mitochondrial intermediate peptidase [Punctularia strigosozonata HHB-11173 SS5]EIN13977.1 mitochondrial intermediate peptidase [Punctularia strigosozonata HHB-11173 SS5]